MKKALFIILILTLIAGFFFFTRKQPQTTASNPIAPSTSPIPISSQIVSGNLLVKFHHEL